MSMKFWFVLSLILILALGCKDKEEQVRLARVEHMLLVQSCENVGHAWKLTDYDSIPQLLRMDICRMVFNPKEGTIYEEEFDGPWEFKCQRCGAEHYFSPLDLTQDMRTEIRWATGCWPKTTPTPRAESPGTIPNRVDWLIVAEGYTATGSEERIVLDGNASLLNDAYSGMILQVGRRVPVQIVAYDGSTRACTAQPPLVVIPQAGEPYRIVMPTPLDDKGTAR